MQLWQPNQQLQNGKFTIQKVLGGGGYGVTYSAVDANTNQTVAIKTLNPIHHSQVDFEQEQVKFVQEAFRLKGCSHPYIVKIHEVIGEEFTVADVAVGSILNYIPMMLKLDLSEYPNVTSYMNKLAEPSSISKGYGFEGLI